jgi:hypothetical protein
MLDRFNTFEWGTRFQLVAFIVFGIDAALTLIWIFR